MGTLSKKVKAPEITEADKHKAAIEVQKNSIKGSIFERETDAGILNCMMDASQTKPYQSLVLSMLCMCLQGVSTTQAQQKYMDLLSECPAFASMF